MPKGSPELTAARKDEIMNACEKLYQKKIFKEITLQDISRETSFTRTSIYNYFETKEEIFLELFKREYDLWTGDIEKLTDKVGEYSRGGDLRWRLQALCKRENSF